MSKFLKTESILSFEKVKLDDICSYTVMEIAV